MPSRIKSLRRLLTKESFVYVPVAYDAPGATLVQQISPKARSNSTWSDAVSRRPRNTSSW